MNEMVDYLHKEIDRITQRYCNECDRFMKIISPIEGVNSDLIQHHRDEAMIHIVELKNAIDTELSGIYRTEDAETQSRPIEDNNSNYDIMASLDKCMEMLSGIDAKNSTN